MKVKPVFLVILVFAVTAAAAYFIYPGWFNARYQFQPWRLGLDLIGGSHLIYEADLSQVRTTDRDSVLAGLRDVIERRVNLFGVSEPQVYLAESGGTARLIVELAGIKDIQGAISQIGLTPLLYFAEVELEDKAGQQSAKFNRTNLTGRYIKGAQLTFEQLTRQPEISLEFDKEGAKIFEEITGRNVGQPLAVFLDEQLIQMPTVQEKISGGQARITGKFSIREAREVVERFNAGALPAPIKLVSQQTIGAALGSDSLKRTIWAGFWGTIAIVIFMMIYYRKLGVVSSIALLIYIILTMAVFKLLGITMTLAGIAGFVLSIGMAIDANILIFERVKEEIKQGLSQTTALADGFRRAWPSIRDSNITTIITALVLYYFTTSFVKGFALALLIGVVMSMFSAIAVTKSLLKLFVIEQPSER